MDARFVRFLVVGHITRDLTPQGYALGGAASFAGIAARRLGAEVMLVTRAHPDDARQPALAGIDVINLPSAMTTTFRNDYHNGIRKQSLQAVARPILAADMPLAAMNADVALLAPVAQDVDPEIASRLHGLVGAAPQGWQREWDASGLVHMTPWQSAGRVLRSLDAVILSDVELAADSGLLAALLQTVPHIVITKSDAGCTLYTRGAFHRIPTRPAREIDPTGAGDVFTAAFLLRLRECNDPVQAAYFANVTASMSVEATGVDAIPDRAQVDAYIQAHPLP